MNKKKTSIILCSLVILSFVTYDFLKDYLPISILVGVICGFILSLVNRIKEK